jgi:ferredoxin
MDQPRIWIDPGCIRCRWCQLLIPQIFVDTEQGSAIRHEVRIDGRCDANRERHTALVAGTLDDSGQDYLRFVADGCPTHVIRVET